VKGRKILTYFIVLIASFGIFSVLSVKGAEAAVEPGTGGGGVVKKCQNDFDECVFNEKMCPGYPKTWWQRDDCVYYSPLLVGVCNADANDYEKECTENKGEIKLSVDVGGVCVWGTDRPSDDIVDSLKCFDRPLLACSCGDKGCPPGTIPNPLDPNCEGGKNTTLGYLIGRVLPFIPVALGIVLLIMIIIGGLKVATAGDNEEAKKKGLSTITNALIGAGILLLALVIVALLEAIFKVKILYGLNIG